MTDNRAAPAVIRTTPISETTPAPPTDDWTGQVRWLTLLWVVFVALLVLRDPQVVLHAEFWGEDGWAWFPDAYNQGAASLFIPLAGYLQTFSRLVGYAAQAAPIGWAPTLFVVAALAVQAAPPVLLVSSRLHPVWPSRCGRLAFALLWIALPNTREVYANLTNAQWHLAALAFLVLMAGPPQRWLGRVFDFAALALSGLSGPICLLLLPVAVWQAATRRTGITELRACVVIAAAMVQGWTLVHTAGSRTVAPLGADGLLFARVVAQQVLLAPFTGQAHMARLQSLAEWQSGVLPVAVVIGGAVLAVIAFWRGPPILRMACILGGLVLAAGLIRPQISQEGSQWTLMQGPGVGQRYYYLPMLAWIGVVIWLGSVQVAMTRLGCAVLAVGLVFGASSDWAVPIRQPTGFQAQAKAFGRLPPGAAMAFPINPLMGLVPMVLIRR